MLSLNDEFNRAVQRADELTVAIDRANKSVAEMQVKLTAWLDFIDELHRRAKVLDTDLKYQSHPIYVI